jgi:hypothetical protein
MDGQRRQHLFATKELPVARLHGLVALVVLLLLSLGVFAEELSLETAQGTIAKVEKDSLTMKTRTPDGKFGKNLTLKLTGTSKVSTVTGQMRSGKLVVVQKEVPAKDLQPGQPLVVIYTMAQDAAVLLSAVAQPAEK